MKPFFSRGLKFLGVFLLVYFLTAPLLLLFQNPMMIKRSWYRVYTRVLRSQKNIKSNELYLGDSVAGQFFHASKKENYLTTNGSVLMSGHYILACNALENNPNIKSVILLSVPNAIGHEFERPRTYNYFVRPFYSRRHMRYMDEHIKMPMAEKPSSKLMWLDGLRILPTADVDFGTLLQEEKELATLSDLSIKYLKKLKDKCDEHGVNLYLISPPV